MENETKICQNCKKEFVIESEDFSFYQKMNVPPPTWCPECRMYRRFSFANMYYLFWRTCNLCGEKTLSMYSPEDKVAVYCPKCWWGDSWDGTEYATEYDPSRPFFDQVKELSLKTPYVGVESLYTSLKNSTYTSGVAWCKDCYMVIGADFCENVFYSSMLNGVKYSMDCLSVRDSELCYGSFGLYKCYRTFFSERCESCVDVWFSRSCFNCRNCVGCVNLRGESYCIFNIKYTKEEYFQKLEELNLKSFAGLEKFKKQAFDLWLTKPYRVYTGHTLNLDVTGEYVFTSKNSKNVYLCDSVENCKWTQFVTVPPAKDCFDYSVWGNNATLVYESVHVGENVNNVMFSSYCFPDCLNLQYCIWNIAGKNNFGCVNLKRKSYCILNKQYSKEEYEKLKAQIIEDMKKNPYTDKLGREFYYGEFFPLEFSRFAYNKSNAMRFLPKTKEEALAGGYAWDDRPEPVYKTTMGAGSLPNTIEQTKDGILNEVIECANCKRGYKVTKGELDLLRKLGLPAPRECPKCRENARFARLNPPKLWRRRCAKCQAEINTAFSPDRPEIVYCEKCYQGEFL